MEDKKLRVEDAKNATFAAVEEGVVPGGGAALLHLRESIPAFKETLTNSEERLGADIVYKSLRVCSTCCLIWGMALLAVHKFSTLHSYGYRSSPRLFPLESQCAAQ